MLYKVYKSDLSATYQILLHPDCSCCQDKVNGAVGRRAGALFFARHRDYFIVTRNFTAIYLDLVPFHSFTVTRSSLPSTRTGKKQVTATQTAPNQTAGPLGCNYAFRSHLPACPDRFAALTGQIDYF